MTSEAYGHCGSVASGSSDCISVFEPDSSKRTIAPHRGTAFPLRPVRSSLSLPCENDRARMRSLMDKGRSGKRVILGKTVRPSSPVQSRNCVLIFEPQKKSSEMTTTTRNSKSTKINHSCRVMDRASNSPNSSLRFHRSISDTRSLPDVHGIKRKSSLFGLEKDGTFSASSSVCLGKSPLPRSHHRPAPSAQAKGLLIFDPNPTEFKTTRLEASKYENMEGSRSIFHGSSYSEKDRHVYVGKYQEKIVSNQKDSLGTRRECSSSTMNDDVVSLNSIDQMMRSLTTFMVWDKSDSEKEENSRAESNSVLFAGDYLSKDNSDRPHEAVKKKSVSDFGPENGRQNQADRSARTGVGDQKNCRVQKSSQSSTASFEMSGDNESIDTYRTTESEHSTADEVNSIVVQPGIGNNSEPCARRGYRPFKSIRRLVSMRKQKRLKSKRKRNEATKHQTRSTYTSDRGTNTDEKTQESNRGDFHDDSSCHWFDDESVASDELLFDACFTGAEMMGCSKYASELDIEEEEEEEDAFVDLDDRSEVTELDANFFRKAVASSVQGELR